MSALIRRLFDLQTAALMITEGNINASKIIERGVTDPDEIKILDAIERFNAAKGNLESTLTEIAAKHNIKYPR